MYEVLSIPKVKENVLDTFMNPGMDFIATFISEQHCIPMTQKQADACKGGNIKICKPNVVNHLATAGLLKLFHLATPFTQPNIFMTLGIEVYKLGIWIKTLANNES